MKLMRYLWISSLSAVSCSVYSAAPASIVGSWNCSASLQQPLFRLTLNSHDRYTRLGAYHTEGTLTATLNGQPVEIQYAVTGDGQWHMNKNTLSLNSSHLKFANISNPQWEKFLNLKQYIPKQASGSFLIETLDQQRLVLNNSRLTQMIQCQRQ